MLSYAELLGINLLLIDIEKAAELVINSAKKKRQIIFLPRQCSRCYGGTKKP